MKNIFNKIITVILAVVCAAFQFDVPAFAASETTVYISDIIVSYGYGDNAEEDAKAWLNDNGYQVVDANLNEGTVPQAVGAAAVYLGYRTSTDKSEAITSIKAMNMTGSYSFETSEKALTSSAQTIIGPSEDHDEYPIPDVMVYEAESSGGELVYTYYNAVQSNRIEKSPSQGMEELKDNADLNGDSGNEWLALYCTKDEGAGEPLIVSDNCGFSVVKGSENALENMRALTIFGEESPVNLTNEEWVQNDINGGLYLYYSVDELLYTASAFANANIWVIFAGTGLLIAAIFFVGGFAAERKKKKGES